VFKHFDSNEIYCTKSVLSKIKASYNSDVTVDEGIAYKDYKYGLSVALKGIKLFSRKIRIKKLVVQQHG